MDYENLFRNISYLFAGGALVIGFQALVGIAYAQAPAQTFGEVYVSLALAIISLANSVWSQYVAQKAKATGQAPNETDLRITNLLHNLSEKANETAATQAQLINWIYEKAVPDQARQIVEGSLPLIKVDAVTKRVGETQANLDHAAELLNEIQAKVSK